MHTCLRCLSDLNFGPGNSSNFASSHRKLWHSSLCDWCRCDIEPSPSAPSQQLISSSCSLRNRVTYTQKYVQVRLFIWGISTGNYHKVQSLRHPAQIGSDLMCTWCYSYINKINIMQTHLSSVTSIPILIDWWLHEVAHDFSASLAY